MTTPKPDVDDFGERPGSLASNLMLFIGSGYALQQTGLSAAAADFRSIHLSIGILFVNAGIGTFAWCVKTKEVVAVYMATYEIRQLLYVGGLNSELYYNAEYHPVVAYGHLLPALIIPICSNFTDYDMEQVTDIVVIAQLISCFYICYKTGNEYAFYACGVAILSTFYHTLLRALKQEDIEVLTFREIDMHNVILTFFALCAARGQPPAEEAEKLIFE